MFKKGDLVYYRDYPDYLNRDVYDEGYGTITVPSLPNDFPPGSLLGKGIEKFVRIMAGGRERSVFGDDVIIIQPIEGDRLGEARRRASQQRAKRAERRMSRCS